jgi:hypothetical protein
MMTLLDVIKSYLNEAEIPQHKTMRLLEIGKRGIMDLHMDVNGLPTTTELEFEPNTLTSPLPSDYITYRKIGYVRGGVIVPFAQNPRIKLYEDNGSCLPANQNKNIDTITGLATGFPQYPYWGGYGISRIAPNGLYGGFSSLGGDKSYTCDFRIDELNGFIQYGCNPNVKIVMEYLANPKMVDGQYVIHPYDVQTVMSWLSWRDIENKKGVSLSEKREKRDEYYRERGQSRKRHYSINLAAAYQKVRQTNKSTLQF